MIRKNCIFCPITRQLFIAHLIFASRPTPTHMDVNLSLKSATDSLCLYSADCLAKSDNIKYHTGIFGGTVELFSGSCLAETCLHAGHILKHLDIKSFISAPTICTLVCIAYTEGCLFVQHCSELTSGIIWLLHTVIQTSSKGKVETSWSELRVFSYTPFTRYNRLSNRLYGVNGVLVFNCFSMLFNKHLYEHRVAGARIRRYVYAQ